MMAGPTRRISNCSTTSLSTCQSMTAVLPRYCTTNSRKHAEQVSPKSVRGKMLLEAVPLAAIAGKAKGLEVIESV